MAILPLIYSPNPLLKEKSQPVEKVDDEIRAFCQDMLDTMYNRKGIGLAAVQVGQLKRILVMDIDITDEGKPGNPIVMINPEIVESSEETCPYEEGCLSFPGQYSEVIRPAEVKVRYLDLQGEIRHLDCDGLAATCVQHEIDHLNGITFVDHISRLKREMILRKMKKAAKQAMPSS